MHWKITNGATFHQRLLHLNWISNCNPQLCVSVYVFACIFWCFIFHSQCQIIQFLFFSFLFLFSFALFAQRFIWKMNETQKTTQTRNSISCFSSKHFCSSNAFTVENSYTHTMRATAECSREMTVHCSEYPMKNGCLFSIFVECARGISAQHTKLDARVA